MLERRKVARATCVALAVLCAACAGSGHDGRSQATGSAITVGSYDFPESVLLAYIYADALAAKGFHVRVLADLGTRELVDPALMTGLIQLVPEYSGSALEFMSLGRDPASTSVATTYRSLVQVAGSRGLLAAEPTAAQDANAIVVTAATAARFHLRTVADLAAVAPGLVFGGPPECSERTDCLLGLERVYGLRFRAFTPTDAGGPLTLQALDTGQIGVALLFTTDPGITAHHLVILADSRALQPAENIVPLVRRSTAGRYGRELFAALNGVSALLSTSVLRDLDARVEIAGLNPQAVAVGWLRTENLIPASPG
jgi:osmoprotectant transport system substrate-binding protein